MPDGQGELYCSFCGKSQNVIKKLIAGPTSLICDECVELCNDILRDQGLQEESKVSSRLVAAESMARTVQQILTAEAVRHGPFEKLAEQLATYQNIEDDLRQEGPATVHKLGSPPGLD